MSGYYPDGTTQADLDHAIENDPWDEDEEDLVDGQAASPTCGLTPVEDAFEIDNHPGCVGYSFLRKRFDGSPERVTLVFLRDGHGFPQWCLFMKPERFFDAAGWTMPKER